MMITEKQRDLLRDLSREREVPLRYLGMLYEVVDHRRDLTRAAASSLINIMKQAPFR